MLAMEQQKVQYGSTDTSLYRSFDHSLGPYVAKIAPLWNNNSSHLKEQVQLLEQVHGCFAVARAKELG